MLCMVVEKIKCLADCLWQFIFGDARGIETRLGHLEEKVMELEQFCQQEQNIPSIVIEQLYVEKIMVDKLEHTNNFGALGIQTLSGMLNIGANYGIGTTPQSKEDKEQNNPPPDKGEKESGEAAGKKNPPGRNAGPKLTINYKK